MNVTTQNISYCTSGMYRNALITAGIKNADVKVAGPFKISGTAALVGVMKAYEEMTGKKISEKSKDAATDELITTGEVAENIGSDDAEKLIADVKQKVAEDNLSSPSEIKQAIEESANDLNISLSDADKEKIQNLMDKISDLDLNVSQLKEQVSEMENHRQVTRAKRQDNPVPVVAIVGYTNAGKSTLLNTVTNAEVLEEDKLFATLDPTTRNYKLPDGQEVLLTDTVGFIRKLPHHLIDAFRSTLEEAKYSDIIIHVVDASNPSMDKNVHAVYETLDNLGVKDKTIITVFNKEDKLETKPILRDFKADYVVHGAIKKGIGIDDINEAIENAVKSMRVLYENVFTYAEAGKTGLIRKYGQLLEEEYKEDGIHVKAYVPTSLIGRLN